MRKTISLSAAAMITLMALPATAQVTQQSSPRAILGSILGTMFGGGRVGPGTTLDGQWLSGQTPLNNQQSEFESRVDVEVRSGNLDRSTGARLKSDSAYLVQLESQYAADGRFTVQERADLADRYTALTQVLADRGYGSGATTAATATATATATADVASGRAEFNSRVDAALAARRITRTQGTRLKADYAAAVQLESRYLRDGAITAAERDDLEARLDALDAKLGDSGSPRRELNAASTARCHCTYASCQRPHSRGKRPDPCGAG